MKTYEELAQEMFPLAPKKTALKQYARYRAALEYLRPDEVALCQVCQQYINYDLMEDTEIGLVCGKCFEENQEDPGHCGDCSGSGEGQYDGTRCPTCRGSGSAKRLDVLTKFYKEEF